MIHQKDGGQVGQTISHYKILEKLGEGGMGIVYRARDTKLNRDVALKFLPVGLEAHEPERARFLQEAQAASALNHPNICNIHALGDHEGQQFIDMEFVDGETLRKSIVIGHLSFDKCISYTIQIAEALQEAHGQGIVHRDVKPENIMVNKKNQIKVMDFGLAKLKGSLKLTKTSSTVGTLAYMAPEQIRGEEVDARSDIFSLGIVLYEMLTGHIPFRGDHEAALMYSILNEDPVPVQNYIPDVSPELLHMLDRSLEKDREERYQTVHDMLIDLRRMKKQTTKVDRTSIGPIPVSDRSDIKSQSAHVSRARFNKRTLYISAGALVIIAFVILWRILLFKEKPSGESYPFQKFKPDRIATNARPLGAAISPDGKYIIYSVDDSGKRSVWMRHVKAESKVLILPPEDIRYFSFTFSPDGDQVYYAAKSQNNPKGSICVVPALGGSGSSRTVVKDVAGGVAVSPDGNQLAFIRSYPEEGGEALIVCNADGTDERKIVSRKRKDFFTAQLDQAPAWSPDGKFIATSCGSTGDKFYMSVLIVSVAEGSTRLATSRKWEDVGRVLWTNDGIGILLVAEERLKFAETQLWYIDLTSGDAHRITSDLNSYDGSSLSITADQSKLLALHRNSSSTVYILPGGGWHRAKSITPRSSCSVWGLDWTPDRRLVYTSDVNGNYDIWMMNDDGSNLHQLTNNLYNEFAPSVSWDGKSITYASTKDTTAHIWLMDIDGNNQRCLTKGDFEDNVPVFSPDPQWIYFLSFRDNGKPNFWKVPTDGGEPVKIFTETIEAHRLGFSLVDSSVIVKFLQTSDDSWRWSIYSLKERKYKKLFDLPTTASGARVLWMPDGKGISYIDTRNGVSNIWVLPLDSMKPYQFTYFESGQISDYAWSKDGKDLAIIRVESTSDIVLLTDLK